ncbi:MAG: YitT family protein [Coriobacteriia bacterium]|nr:YitT family protein [Coriobacteriia bacterium]
MVSPGLTPSRVLRARPVRDYALMTVGLALTAYGLDAFLIPNKIAAGGVSGLATVIYYTLQEAAGLEVSIALQVLLMNVVLLVIAIQSRGLTYVAKTIFGIVGLSIFIGLFAQFNPVVGSEDLLLAALYGGVISGLGVGLVFKGGGNTGGTDIVAQLLASRFPLGVGQIMLVVDAAVTLLAAIAFGPVLAMYGAVAIFVGSVTIDVVLEGIPVEKAAFIISDQNDAIAQAIVHEMGRGATMLQATGVWTGDERRMLFVVLSRNEIDSLKRVVATLDPTAMVVISDVHETIGEGFKAMPG